MGVYGEVRAVTPTLPRRSRVCFASFPPGALQSGCSGRPESALTRAASRRGFAVATRPPRVPLTVAALSSLAPGN